jgi:tetratricopeptide (TPR) repeat protein
MRTWRVILAFAAAVPYLVQPAPIRAQSPADAAQLERAATMFDQGNRSQGLAAVEGVLAHAPENMVGLYRSALFNFEMGNIDVARGRLERLVKVSGNYYAGWELMTQVTQAQGDLARRDQAIERLKIAMSTAIDPEIRGRGDFIRDRIPTNMGEVLVTDYFDRGGSDFTRYQFLIGDPHAGPDLGLLLRTDADTTDDWQQTALMPPDQQLFHLDMVDLKPEGGQKVAIYQYYVGEPDYDTVRAKVMQVLRGEVQPLSGEPGSLQGVLKP